MWQWKDFSKSSENSSNTRPAWKPEVSQWYGIDWGHWSRQRHKEGGGGKGGESNTGSPGCQIFRQSRARSAGRPSERTVPTISPGRRGLRARESPGWKQQPQSRASGTSSLYRALCRSTAPQRAASLTAPLVCPTQGLELETNRGSQAITWCQPEVPTIRPANTFPG